MKQLNTKAANILQRLRELRQPRRLLAVETDGFGLRAALIRADGRNVVFECVAQTEAADTAQAIAEAVAKLRQGGRQLPREAVLLLPTVVPALLELPVSPQQPRPYLQMQEILRWELEPFMLQRVGLWRLGAVLLWRGYLDEGGLLELIRELERRKAERKRQAGERQAATLIGEIAVELGFITREQRDECLRLQEQLQTGDDEVVCGWSPQPADQSRQGRASTDGAAEVPEKSPWLACGMSRKERSRFVDIFQEQGLELGGVYPLVGCSAAALAGSLPATSAMIEARAGVVGCMRLEGERVTSLELYHTASRTFADAAAVERQTAGAETLHLSGADHGIRPLAEIFGSLRQRGAGPVPLRVEAAAPPPGVTTDALAGMAGAARHRWGLPGASRAVAVPARDPGPPLQKRVSTWWIAAGLAAVLLIGSVESWLAWRLRAVRTEHTETISTVNSLQGELNAIKEQSGTIEKLRAALAERQQEMAAADRLRRLLEEELPGRGERMLSLLDRVAAALPEEMMIQRIEAGEQGAVTITGWALSERGIQRFAQRLARETAPLGFKIIALEATMKASEGLAGHTVMLRIVPAEAQAPATMPAEETR